MSAVKHGLVTDRRMGYILSNSSVRHYGGSMVADAGGVGGEGWTCDGQTNGYILSNSSVRHHGGSMVARW